MSTVRKNPLVNGEIYHVFNRGIDKRTTFTSDCEYLRACLTIKFYQFVNPPARLSRYLLFSEDFRRTFDEKLTGEKLTTIFAYCLMPNHFHFLIRQEVDGGISKFIGQFLNSYTKYFNTKHKRIGGLFLDQFKNTLMLSEGQLLHVSRYIHLNPYSSGVVKDLSKLISYKWSSFGEYLGSNGNVICDKKLIINSFNGKAELYKKFVLDRAEYQKELKEMEE